jgi:hypothetical protein
MFVGHYGPAFAAKALPHAPSLGAAFVAVQLVDYAWAGLVLAGIEHGRVEAGFLALSDLRLDYMPFTHSLPAALLWSFLGALVYRAIDRRGGWAAAALIGACVFSHWLMDLLVHAPDLALWGDDHKVGLGWWDQPVLGVSAELGVLAGGFFFYLSATRAKNAAGAIFPFVLIALLIALQIANWTDALGTPESLQAMAPQALGAYTLIAALGFALDATRTRKQDAIRATG